MIGVYLSTEFEIFQEVMNNFLSGDLDKAEVWLFWMSIGVCGWGTLGEGIGTPWLRPFQKVKKP